MPRYLASLTPLRRSVLVFALLAAACTSHRQPASAPPAVAATAAYPGVTWERFAEPEAAGFSRAGLEAATVFLRTLPTTGLMVVVHGRVLLEYGDVREVSYLASARKSVLSMLYGKYVAAGRIRLDKTLAEIGIDDQPPLTADERRATVRDLLLTSSGVFHAASNGGDNLADAPPRGSQKPGTYYLYSNWDFNALGTIFERETGRAVFDALETDLARPIGMEDYDRGEQRMLGDTTQSRHLAYHMWLSTRDMARLGLLMLRGGRWNAAQVIPARWIEESTSLLVQSSRMHPPFRASAGYGYGYLWWILEEPPESPMAGGYVAQGAYGQYILVVPKLDMVVAHKRNVRSAADQKPVLPQDFMALVRLVVSAKQ